MIWTFSVYLRYSKKISWLDSFVILGVNGSLHYHAGEFISELAQAHPHILYFEHH